MTVLLVSSIVGVWYSVIVVATAGKWFFLGILLFIASFRLVILAYDLMWGRPPAFSKRPWERPWDQQ
ncbi:MAG TPA: hypothetical protein VMM81_07520 [Acidimicrobiia bacterium]|nr:hypothetical protein [Acidimicrobiia bacterium]